MKKIIQHKSFFIIFFLLIIIVILSLQIISLKSQNNEKITSTDAEKFASEYSKVSSDNVFVYIDANQALELMKNDTCVIYFGFPECIWCQDYVKYLDEVAKQVDISKVYYCNTNKTKQNNMDEYNNLISALSGNLQYNDEGKEWLYVPTVAFFVNGKLIGINYETSKDTNNLKSPSEYWTEEKIANLKEQLAINMINVLSGNDTSNSNNESSNDLAKSESSDSINLVNPKLDELKALNLPIILGCGSSSCASCKTIESDLSTLHNEFQDKVIIGNLDINHSLLFFYKHNLKIYPSIIFINSNGSPYVPKNKEIIDKNINFEETQNIDKTETYTLLRGSLDIDTLRLIINDMLT